MIKSKNYLILFLILSSFLSQSIIIEDHKIYEEPRLIGVTKDILEKKKQQITLVFQNSKISPIGFQGLYLRGTKNNALYKVNLSCKDHKIFIANILGVFCEIDLKSSDIRFSDLFCRKYFI